MRKLNIINRFSRGITNTAIPDSYLFLYNIKNGSIKVNRIPPLPLNIDEVTNLCQILKNNNYNISHQRIFVTSTKT